MAFFVAEGKTVTTARGAVTGGVGNDQLTPACLVKDKTDKVLLKAAAERLKVLAEKGVLVEADEHPVSDVKAAEAEAVKVAAEAAEAEAVKVAAEAAEAEAVKVAAEAALAALTDEERATLATLTDEERATLATLAAEERATSKAATSKRGKGGKGGAKRGD